MPPIITNPRSTGNFNGRIEFQEFSAEDAYRKYSERYPNGVDLRPGSPLSDRLTAFITEKASESERFMSQRHGAWEQMDEVLTAFIPLDEKERLVKEKDPRRPVSIVIPETYATLETLLTYNMAAFGGPPLFRYEGVGPEDTIGAIRMELDVELQTKKAKTLLDLHTHWRDNFTYGLSPMHAFWSVRTGKRMQTFDDIIIDPFGQEQVVSTSREAVPAILFEGTELDAIDPYRYLPDPSVEIHKPQHGEYVGWMDESAYFRLLRMEQELGSNLFNVQFLRGRSTRGGIYRDERSGRETHTRTGSRDAREGQTTQIVDVIWMYADIIPKELKLSQRDTPEKWLFGLAGLDTIICAHPIELNHDMFPIVVAASDFGGHEFLPTARLEIMQGLQGSINFFINSHIANVRKALNDMFLVDPKSVNMNDLTNPQPGKLIRTRKSLWGRGVKDLVQQFNVTDVTGNHMSDAQLLTQISRNSLGTTDAAQGVQRTRGERVTAQEFSQTRTAALSRLQKSAQILSLQSMHDLALMFAYNTQQFKSQESFAKTQGRWKEVLEAEFGTASHIPISPMDLDIAFDVVSHDGSIETDQDAASWNQLYQILLSDPIAMQAMDTPRIFMHIGRLLGEKNMQEFRRVAPVVLPDQQVGDLAASGQLQRVGAQG